MVRSRKKKSIREQREELQKSMLPNESVVTFTGKATRQNAKTQRMYILGALGVALLLGLFWWVSGARARALSSFAEGHKFEFNPASNRFFKKEQGEFSLLHRGERSAASNVMKGQYGAANRDVTVFDLSYTESVMTKGKKYRKKITEKTYGASGVIMKANTAVTPEEEQRQFCPLVIRPRTLIQLWANRANEDLSLAGVEPSAPAGITLPKLFGDKKKKDEDATQEEGKDTEATEPEPEPEPEQPATPLVEPSAAALAFNESFTVRSLCSDEVVQQLLTDEVMVLMSNFTGVVVEMQGDSLMVYSEVTLETDELDQIMEAADQLLQTLPHVPTPIDEIKAHPVKEDENADEDADADADAPAKDSAEQTTNDATATADDAASAADNAAAATDEAAAADTQAVEADNEAAA